MHSHLQPNQIITLSIHAFGSSGEGVGQLDGYTIFVEGALPTELIEARLFEIKKRYGRAELIRILHPSSDRVNPICPLFGRCGGCQLMHLSYSKQVEMKRQKVVDALGRIGKLENANVLECVPSPSSLHYRNKIQLPALQEKGRTKLGLYARSSHDIVEVDECFIHSSLGQEVYHEVQRKVKNYTGELRHLLIKSALRTQEVLVVLVSKQKASSLMPLAEEIFSSHPAIKGVVHNLHTEKENVILGKEYTLLQGRDHIHEKLSHLLFKISPASFFQINPEQAEQLYAKALEFAQLTGNERVLDAYCGVGTLSLFFATKAKEVIGVECVEQAIEDAKENAKINQTYNVSFVCAPSETYIQRVSNIDILLLNPPRKGCDPLFLQGVCRLGPKNIIYISCDPATLARDLAYLNEQGYRIDVVQPYDMFPQTAHVECVARLQKK